MSLAREIRLARMPGDRVSADDFVMAETPLPALQDGDVRVRNMWMSVDPYMRLPLTGRKGVRPGLSVGDPMFGAAVGVVEESRAPAMPAGALVLSQKGWRDRFVAPASDLQALPVSDISPSWYLGVLGLSGMTAYPGVEEVLRPVAGETLFVSAAAGAVGSLACQLARRRGVRVLGSAGSDDKVAWLKDELGLDGAVNYRRQDVGAFLKAECPNGLDCYFDNVGGATLDAALGAMRPGGRIGLCGAISQYNDDNYRAGPADFFTIIEKGLVVTGFNAGLAAPRGPEIAAALIGLLQSGELRWKETVVEGLENAPAAFASLFEGENVGKLIVRI
ncbi:MAG: NADP-dependent oxidoreductase [Phenylobacterium sp.]|uniref:NADP-dependent oxidoreductase n=1 Tax=Phenylobacterium sp. TaxID=1871053 RepID=UPI00120EA281|nr:NADP-dependent oxidoreductase [Phenylobacterium sp.]TAJ74301.1 MAG: NADP-dependent oxidoreductase [Phenylobacterium sp.]